MSRELYGALIISLISTLGSTASLSAQAPAEATALPSHEETPRKDEITSPAPAAENGSGEASDGDTDDGFDINELGDGDSDEDYEIVEEGEGE